MIRCAARSKKSSARRETNKSFADELKIIAALFWVLRETETKKKHCRLTGIFAQFISLSEKAITFLWRKVRLGSIAILSCVVLQSVDGRKLYRKLLIPELARSHQKSYKSNYKIKLKIFPFTSRTPSRRSARKT